MKNLWITMMVMITAKDLEDMMIKEIDHKSVSDDGKIYYEIALNLSTGEQIRIKNPGCTAAALSVACEYFGVPDNALAYKTVKTFFQGTSAELNLNMIPKKYHKYFKEK